MIIIVDKLKNESCSIYAKVQYIVPICKLVNLSNSYLCDLELDQNFFNVRKDIQFGVPRTCDHLNPGSINAQFIGSNFQLCGILRIHFFFFYIAWKMKLNLSSRFIVLLKILISIGCGKWNWQKIKKKYAVDPAIYISTKSIWWSSQRP